jgi:hypothetical protein
MTHPRTPLDPRECRSILQVVAERFAFRAAQLSLRDQAELEQISRDVAMLKPAGQLAFRAEYHRLTSGQ